MPQDEIPLIDPFIASIAKTAKCDAWIGAHQVTVTDVLVSGNGAVRLVVEDSDYEPAEVAGSTVTVFVSTLLNIIAGRLAHDDVCDCSQYKGKHDGTCEAGRLIGAQLKISMHKKS